MKILQKCKMIDGTTIQIEDWSKDYKFMPFAGTIAAYPVSKFSLEGQFAPKTGEKFRVSFNFETTEEAERAYSSLIEGKTDLGDYIEFMNDKRNEKCL